MGYRDDNFGSRVERHIESVMDHPVLTIAKWVTIIGALTLIITGIGWGVKLLTTPAKVLERVVDPDRVLYTYELYHELYQDYLATRSNLRVASSDLATFDRSTPSEGRTFQDREERVRLHTVVMGLRQRLSAIAADYNAKSRMASRNLFKDNNLPERLPSSATSTIDQTDHDE